VDTAESVSNGFDDPAAEKKSETPKTITIAPRQKVFTFDSIAVDSYAPIVRPTGDIKSTYLSYNPSNEVSCFVDSHYSDFNPIYLNKKSQVKYD